MPDTKTQLADLFMKYVVPLLITGAFSGSSYALVWLGTWIKEKVKNARVALLLGRLDQFVLAVVNDLEATVKPDLISSLADGKLTKEKASQLKAMALARVKNLLAQEGHTALTELLGVAASLADSFISGKIEQAVSSLPGRSPSK